MHWGRSVYQVYLPAFLVRMCKNSPLAFIFCAAKQWGLSPAGGFQTPASIVAETSQGMQSLFDLGLLGPGNMEIW